MFEFKEDGLYFLPLGGAEEVGFNLYVYSNKGRFIIVDMGYGFLNDDFPGMEMGMADTSFLNDYIDKIDAIFVTHAHEDHFGAIAHFWPKVKCPIYATPFTMGHIKARFYDYRIKDYEDSLKVITDGDIIKLDAFEVKVAYLTHSTPENSALFIKTENSNIIHATDWCFDDSNTGMFATNFDALAEFSKEGVDVLVCDSTNVGDEKAHSYSEAEIRDSLIDIISTLEKTVVATCFPSNILRLQSLMIAADRAGRTPVVAGMSILRNIKVAKDCGYWEGMPNYLEAKDSEDIPLDKILYICAGSQGNYRSALSRIVNEENKHMLLGIGDTVLFSSQIIPGNEQRIERMQEKLRNKGVNVINKEEHVVHTSGHGGKKDIMKMYEILKPKTLVPVHGDKKYLREHARFAKNFGINNVINIKNGEILLLHKDKQEVLENVKTNIIGIDRNQLTAIDSDLVKNRRRIMYNGSLFITAIFAETWKLEDLQVSSIDVIEEKDFYALSEDIICRMREEIPTQVIKLNYNENQIIDFIKAKIRKQIFSKTGIKPVVFMHFYKA